MVKQTHGEGTGTSMAEFAVGSVKEEWRYQLVYTQVLIFEAVTIDRLEVLMCKRGLLSMRFHKPCHQCRHVWLSRGVRKHKNGINSANTN